MKIQRTNNFSKKVNVAVYVIDGKIDEALRKFKKKVEKYEVLDIYKAKQYYIKPSEAKRLKLKKKK